MVSNDDVSKCEEIESKSEDSSSFQLNTLEMNFSRCNTRVPTSLSEWQKISSKIEEDTDRKIRAIQAYVESIDFDEDPKCTPSVNEIMNLRSFRDDQTLRDENFEKACRSGQSCNKEL